MGLCTASRSYVLMFSLGFLDSDEFWLHKCPFPPSFCSCRGLTARQIAALSLFVVICWCLEFRTRSTSAVLRVALENKILFRWLHGSKRQRGRENDGNRLEGGGEGCTLFFSGGSKTELCSE